ncbi:hypothetical protein SEUCBS139899_004185 [Sporothrix eucalyptigena]
MQEGADHIHEPGFITGPATDLAENVDVNKAESAKFVELLTDWLEYIKKYGRINIKPIETEQEWSAGDLEDIV